METANPFPAAPRRHPPTKPAQGAGRVPEGLLNHGSTEDTETATENRKDLVGVPFTLKLFPVPSYRPPPNLPSRKNSMSCRPALVLHQVRHHLADHAAELVAVAGEPGRDRDLRMGRVPVQDEVAVGGVGEHAGLEHERGPVALREIAAREGAEQLLVLGLGIRGSPCPGPPFSPRWWYLPNLKPGMRKLGKP